MKRISVVTLVLALSSVSAVQAADHWDLANLRHDVEFLSQSLCREQLRQGRLSHGLHSFGKHTAGLLLANLLFLIVV